MVPVGVAPIRARRREAIIQSADFAVRDLLEAGDDPFALAWYLWVARRHGICLIDGDRLAAWGVAHARRVLIERNVGRRRDEEYASAALVVAALAPAGRALAPAEREAMARTLRDEITLMRARNAVPYGNAAYGGGLLLGASVLGLDADLLRSGGAAVASAYESAASGGSMLGVDLAIRVLTAVQESERARVLAEHLRTTLRRSGTSYEDELFVANALLATAECQTADASLIDEIDPVCERSPVWPYIMVGIEEVPAATPDEPAIVVSHLCRTALLDVTLRLHATEAARCQMAFDARYSGRALVGVGAFGFWMLPLLLLCAGLARYAAVRWDAAFRYWLLGDYTAMSRIEGAAAYASVLVAPLLVGVTAVAAVTLWALMVRRRIESDRRIVEILAGRVWRVVAGWLVLALIATTINVTTGLTGTAMQHLVTGP